MKKKIDLGLGQNNNKNGNKIIPVSSKEKHVNSLYFLSNHIKESKGYSNIDMNIEGFTKVNNKKEIILEIKFNKRRKQ